MSDCKKCKWLVKGKSGREYCLASEEIINGDYIVNVLNHALVSDEEWIEAPCFDYNEGE